MPRPMILQLCFSALLLGGLAAVPASTVAAQTSTTLTLQKAVTVNGLGYYASNTARPGDTLTYRLTYSNATAAAATDVTITDVLAPGQTYVTNFQGGCDYIPATRTVSCLIGTVRGNGTASIYLYTAIDDGFRGVIPNSATVSSSNAPTVTSNTTRIYVGAPLRFPAGTLYLCGQASGPIVPGGTVTVSGVTLSVAVGASVTGVAITPGQSYCLGIQLNAANQIASTNVTTNLAGVGYVCGLYTASSAATITVGGIVLPLGMTSFPIQLVAGEDYCFLLSSSGSVTGILSSVPTRAQPARSATIAHRIGRAWVE